MEAVKKIPEKGIVILNGTIDDNTAAEVCVALLELEAESHGEQITMMVNSPGGSVQAGWQIVDTIRLIGNVETICTGLAASMAALVVMAGKKGCRSILPHAKVMLHQPLGGTGLVQASDFTIVAREMERTKQELYSFICDCTGKSLAQVEADCDRDYWLNAEESKSYGLVDRIESREIRNPIYPAGNI